MKTQQVHAAVLHATGQTPRSALKPCDRLMADGVGYAPAPFPQVVGLDGVGRLQDGTRVAFMIPPRPYGGMAERYESLVRQAVTGELILDVEPVPLADVEETWPQAGSDRRIVFVP
jgi:hypothetical protein